MRRNSLKAFALALAFVSLVPSGASAATDYPSRPITFIVPSAPGGPHDLIARTLSPKLAALLGQPIVIDNKPGGAMIVATSALAKARPDGLTIGSVATPFVTNPFLMAKLPYDTYKDFTPVAALAVIPSLLIVRGDSPYMTFKDFIAAGRKQPDGGFKFGSPAVGGMPHLAGELLKKQAGMPGLHIPYKGGIPEVRLALLRGDLDFMFDSFEASEMIKAGRLRAIGIATAERVASMPDLPTLAETLPGLVSEAFLGVMVPAGTPPEIVQKLNSAINQAVSSPEVSSRLKELGFLPVTMTSQQYKSEMDAQLVKWGAVVKSLNLTPQ